VISHELKTPVSIIKGYAEMLARPDVTWRPEQIRDSLQIIIEEADRLGNEINSLLDVSRMQLNALHLELSSWPIQALIEQVCVRFAAQAERSGVHLEVRISEDIPDVFADREKTRLVCENLITNAMKYSPSGGTIRIQGRRDQALAIISVTDQGIGIPLEEQGKIFDRFYRVDNRVSRETQGFGIGLFLAKSIVEAQKGQIWVESRPQQGARFSFSLPLSTSRIGGTVEIADDVVIDLSSGEEST
jgi:signal transduction histidine kinase